MVSGLPISDGPCSRLLRPVAHTYSPARASSTAIPRPAPRVAPATSATRSTADGLAHVTSKHRSVLVKGSMSSPAGRLPLDEQASYFRQLLHRNDTLVTVLDRAAAMDLPGWYLVAGCLYQTVWNAMTGRPAEVGILDYDLAYFDGSDLSWEAEDAVIQAGNRVFAGLPAPVQIRNQARVHLWYEQKFGRACPPHDSTETAITTFEATTASVGVRLEPGVQPGSGGRLRVYAPYGLSDIFDMVVRPNPVLASREVYEAKTARWLRQWPELTVLPWPA